MTTWGLTVPVPPRLQKIIPPIPPDLGAQGQCLVPLPSAVPLFSPAIGLYLLGCALLPINLMYGNKCPFSPGPASFPSCSFRLSKVQGQHMGAERGCC